MKKIIMKRLHIVGCPRSGTTLMMELCATCFESSGFCSHEMNIFVEPEGKPDIYFSKKPSDIKYIEKIFKKDAGLFLIYMMRDPRSVVTSIHRSRAGEYFCNYRVWKTCNDASKNLEDNFRFICIRYEDLVQYPDRVQIEIMERFSFLKKKCSFSKYERFANPSKESVNAMNGLRPINNNRVKGWLKHLPRIKLQLEKHPEMIIDLIENGYEDDSKWTNMLENVIPFEYKCRYPDKTPLFKNIEIKFRKWLKTRAYISKHKL